MLHRSPRILYTYKEFIFYFLPLSFSSPDYMRVIFHTFLFLIIITTASLSEIKVSCAQNIEKTESFAFKAPSTFGSGDANVNPFAYRGEPLSFHSFLLFPNLTLEQAYNDNVLGTENNEKSDFVTVIKPEIIIAKDIGRHEFTARFASEIRRHFDVEDENVENYNAELKGNIEIKRGLDIPLEISYRNGHLNRIDQRRASVNELTVKPLKNKALELESGIIFKPNRLILSLLGNYREGRLENEELFNGTTLNRDNRNVNIQRAKAQIAYEYRNGFTPFAEVTFAHEDYINEASDAVSRNNDLLRILGGTSFDYKGLVTGFLGIGYEQRNFDDALVKDTNALSLDGSITWEPTAKTKFLFDIARQTFEDNLIVAGLTETTAGIEIRHEFKKDLFGRMHLSYELDDFEDIAREDETYDSEFELLYIIGPHLQLGAGYNYITRESSAAGLGLDNSIVFIRARAAL